MRSLKLNPIFVREARDAMRADAKRDAWGFFYLVCTILFLGALYAADTRGYYHVGAPTIAFCVLCAIQGVISNRFTSPAMSVVRERTQNTYESLILTPMTPHAYLRGHLYFHVVSALRRTALLLPFFAVIYLLGGFTLWRFFIFQLCMIVYSVNVNVSSFAMGEMYAANRAWMQQMQRLNLGRSQVQINPVALLSLILLPLFGLLLISPIRNVIIQAFASASGMPLPPDLEALRAVAIFHPLVVLLMWGDLPIFNVPVPVWLFAIISWGVFAHASYNAFTYAFTHRKFRYNQGLRGSRFLQMIYIQVMVAGIGWNRPETTLVVSFGIWAIYLTARFAGPRTTPVPDGESWQFLPRRDVLVNRAGNMVPFLILSGIPIVALHVLLLSRSRVGNLTNAVMAMDAMLLLCALTILFLNQWLQMRKALNPVDKPKKKKKKDADLPPAEQKEVQKNPFQPSMILAVAIAAWIVPFPFMALEIGTRGTGFHPSAYTAFKVFEPLLLINPGRFAYLLMSSNVGPLWGAPGRMSTYSPWVWPFGLGTTNYYTAALAATGFLTMISAGIYAKMSGKVKGRSPVEKALNSSPDGGTLQESCRVDESEP